MKKIWMDSDIFAFVSIRIGCEVDCFSPTTLKTLFKSVYGTSIAAHMKEHRMERAAKLLRKTGLSIAEIAGSVGYDSQSRFTAAFKAHWGKLPKDYRNTSGISKLQIFS